MTVKVSVVIPAFNETRSIGVLISRIRTLYPDFEIIVIDDGSTDDTGAVAKNSGATVYSHPYNIGNGAAIKSGTYFPEFDMVVGARSKGDHASLGRIIGNTAYNWLASYVAKFTVRDLTSGFRAVKSEIAHNLLYLLPNTYSYPTTLTLSVLRNGRTVKYVLIKAKKRRSGKSGINMFRDGVRFFMIIIKICTLYSPFRVFLPVSFITFLIGLFYYLYTFYMWGRLGYRPPCEFEAMITLTQNPCQSTLIASL
jgi:glycosyltransferase involved in cell wall biosynthesis